jgi:uncharacterized caspase-like protein
MHRDVAPEGAPPSEVTQGRKLICVIGIDQYAHWPHLQNARRDAERIRDLFAELGFAEASPPLLDGEATRQALDHLVKDGLAGLSVDDSLVIFFAGHGNTVARPHAPSGYVIPYDGAAGDGRTSTWIDVKEWLAAIARLPPRHILVALDSCHSGIALQSVRVTRSSGQIPVTAYDGLRRHRSRRVIASATGDEKASDNGPLEGHSLFASGFIAALQAAGDGPLNGTDLAARVQRYVVGHQQKQSPVFGAFELDDGGEMVIAAPLTASVSVDRALGTVSVPRPPARRRSIAVVGAAVLIATATIATLSATPRSTASAPPDAGAAPIALLAAEPPDAGSPPDAAPAAKPKTRRMAARLPAPAPATGRDDDVFSKVDAGVVAGVVALLLGGANVDAQGTFVDKSTGATLRAPALGKAAYDCDLSIVQALIKYGASLRLGAVVVGGKKATAGTTPLMFAAMQCEGLKGAAIARALLDAGAPIEQTDEGRRTALHVVRYRHVAAALLAARAPIEAGAADGATPIIEAARGARKEIVRLLLEHGAKPGAKTAAGETGIWLASAAKVNRKLDPARDDIIERLAFARADVEAAPPGQASPLAQAIAQGALDRAKTLVLHGARVDPLVAAIGAAAIQGDVARKRALCGVLAGSHQPAAKQAQSTCAP